MAVQAETRQERRRHGRVSVLESAVLYADDGCVDCQVTDVSANGARLRPVGRIDVENGPVRVVLARLGVFPASVQWRVGDAMGVQFAVSTDYAAARLDPLLPA